MLQKLPKDSRPREKLIKHGPASLSDAELLSVILRTGTKKRDVINLAQDLIEQFGGLAGLLGSEYAEFCTFHGLGQAKYCQIAAIREIARRSLISELESKILLNNTQAASEFLLAAMSSYQKEVFACLLLDIRNQLISYEELFSGSISGASIYPREVVRLVINSNAAAVIFAHNHPSGNIDPSEADIALTGQLKKALALIDVRVLDHIIVGNGTLSMAEKGLI